MKLLDLFELIHRVTEHAAHSFCLGGFQLRAKLARIGKCCRCELPAKFRELDELWLVGEGDGNTQLVDCLEGFLVH